MILQRMQNADILVAWPTAAGWTLSHRQSPSGENMPVVASTVAATSTSAFYTYLPELSTIDAASSFTAVTYLRFLAAPADYPSTSTFTSLTKASTRFIYASSSIKPDGDAEDAVLTQHNQVRSLLPLPEFALLTYSSASIYDSSRSERSDLARCCDWRNRRARRERDHCRSSCRSCTWRRQEPAGHASHRARYAPGSSS